MMSKTKRLTEDDIFPPLQIPQLPNIPLTIEWIETTENNMEKSNAQNLRKFIKDRPAFNKAEIARGIPMNEQTFSNWVNEVKVNGKVRKLTAEQEAKLTQYMQLYNYPATDIIVILENIAGDLIAAAKLIEKRRKELETK